MKNKSKSIRIILKILIFIVSLLTTPIILVGLAGAFLGMIFLLIFVIFKEIFLFISKKLKKNKINTNLHSQQ